jgi:predicted dinucleotide-binding enzyme
MRIGVLGTGTVGDRLSKALSKLDHEVTIGARSADSESLQPFADEGLLTGSFADAAITSDLVINATNGNFSVDAVASAAAELEGKTLIDLSNRLDHSKGMTAAAQASPENSVALEIQAAVPGTNVVKALNTMNSAVMVDPSLVPGDHVVFVSGDSSEAKAQTTALLAELGWRDSQIIDLGGLETATGPEMLMQLWLDVVVARGGFDAGQFNFAING